MVEPLSIVMISAVVGGTAGKIVEKSWNLGEKWLSGYFKGHLPKAREAAEQNALHFLSSLANRVDVLEKTVTAENRKAMEYALENPDFSVLLQKAILISSRTDSTEKHNILGRLVADRLTSGSEDLVSLTSNLACEAIQYLGTRHLHTLGICVTITSIRPDAKSIQFTDYSAWLSDQLRPMIDSAGCTPHDLYHLMGVSCLHYQDFMFGDLKEYLEPQRDSGITWSAEDFLEKHPVGVKLKQLWDSGLESVTLTSVGSLIGIYVSDNLTGETTHLDW